MSTEQLALAKKIVAALMEQDVAAYRPLIHPGCPQDEPKIKNVVSIPWTNRYQVRQKLISEAFDTNKIKFLVIPESVLEFQVWIKGADGVERELIKVYPLARHEGQLKIMEWPCYDRK